MFTLSVRVKEDKQEEGVSDVKINMKKQGKQVCISISGAIDELGAEEMERIFRDRDIQSAEKVVLDFREVGYVGSAGVGALLLLYKRIAPGNGEVVIENIPTDIYRLLAKDMNLGHVFTMRSV